MIDGMKPELLASAFLLQRLHGSSFAASFLEDFDVPRDRALQLLADRPPDQQFQAQVDCTESRCGSESDQLQK